MKACNYYTSADVRCNNSDIATVQVGALPAKPGGVTLTQVGQGRDINVTWDAVEDADNYKIRWRGEGESLGDPIYATTTQATISLDGYGTWVVRVEACNAAGCGQGSARTITLTAPPTPVPTPIPVPAKPTGVKLLQHQHSLLLLVQVDTMEGADKYNFQWRRAGPGNKLSDPAYVGVAVTTDTFTQTLTMSDYGDWVIRVEACNDSGCSGGSTKRITLVPAPTPTPTPEPTPEPTPTPIPVPQMTGLVVARDVNSLVLDISWDNHGNHNYFVKLREHGSRGYQETNVWKDENKKRINLPRYGTWTVGVKACHPGTYICSAYAEETVKVERATPARISNFEVKDAKRNYTAMVVSWDETRYATHYEIKWRRWKQKFEDEHILNVPHGKFSAEIKLPIGYDWVVRARACNANVCGPAISQMVSVAYIVEISVFGEVQNLRIGVKPATLTGNATWDDVPEATYYKVWYAETMSGPMVPHRVTETYHTFSLPGLGTWDFLVQACNDDECFIPVHRILEVSDPEA